MTYGRKKKRKPGSECLDFTHTLSISCLILLIRLLLRKRINNVELFQAKRPALTSRTKAGPYTLANTNVNRILINKATARFNLRSPRAANFSPLAVVELYLILCASSWQICLNR
jgi:hypothetical protein